MKPDLYVTAEAAGTWGYICPQLIAVAGAHGTGFKTPCEAVQAATRWYNEKVAPAVQGVEGKGGNPETN